MAKSRFQLRWITVAVLVFGVILTLFSISRLTFWAPANSASYHTDPKTKAPLVITGQNVLESTGQSVTITATATKKDTPVQLAIGRTVDVYAWAADKPYLLVTGFGYGTLNTKLEKLRQTDKDKQNSAGNSPQGTGMARDSLTVPDELNLNSDMWVVHQTGIGSVSYTWQLRDNRWSALALGDGTNPVKLSLSWKTNPSQTPAKISLIFGLLIALAAGGFLGALEVSEIRSAAARQRSNPADNVRKIKREAQRRGDAHDLDITSPPPRSRKAIRQLEAAAKALRQASHRESNVGAGTKRDLASTNKETIAESAHRDENTGKGGAE